MTKVTAILLAGGKGVRMGSPTPKQYLKLLGKPMARYSFELFLETPAIQQIVVVCATGHRQVFSHTGHCQVDFAKPGRERQDSAYSGFCEAMDSDLICIHDAAYPLLTQEDLEAVIEAASKHGAAVAATPVPYTIKEVNKRGFVTRTPERSSLWQAQTPQIIRKDLLAQGYTEATKRGVIATDDVALMELINQPVKVVSTDPSNIKVTTPSDFELACQLLEQRLLIAAP